MTRRFLLCLMLIGLLVPVSAARADKSYSADYFNVDVVVEEGGSLLVTESVAFTFVGDPFTFVFREIPVDLTDGITVLSAAVDGRTYPEGTETGQVEVERGNPIRVTWHMEPTADATRVFTLTYRLRGVVQQGEDADVLLYQPLPDEYEYTIDRSIVTITYPGSTMLVDTPRVQAGTAEINQAGNRVTFTAAKLGPDETLVVSLPFMADTIISEPPAWQTAQQSRQARTEATRPFWLALSGVLLVGGLGSVVSYYRRHSVATGKDSQIMYEPPSKLPPALAATLQTSSLEADWNSALAALFDLADRNALEIEEMPKTKWYQSRDFVVRQLKRPSELHPHEDALLELVFVDNKGRPSDEVKLSQLSGRVTGKRWKQFKETVRTEFKDAGYFSESRNHARSLLMYAALVIFFTGTAALIGTAVLLGQVGAWAFAAAGSLTLVGLVGVILGAAITPISDEGALVAAQWRDFKAYLKNVSKGKAAMTRPDMFDMYLPLAAGFGLLYGWAQHLEKEGWERVPHYFHAHSPDSMGAFVAVIAASSSSGGAAAGAGAGAGAAGGGASGAG